jgi:hypothetical protein
MHKFKVRKTTGVLFQRRGIEENNDKEEIKLSGTCVTTPQRNCQNCDKKEDFLDSAYTLKLCALAVSRYHKITNLVNSRFSGVFKGGSFYTS